MAVSHTGLKNNKSRGAAAGVTSISRTRRCLGQLLKLVLSTPGLVLLVIGYSIMGALIFPLLEAPQDLSKSAAIAKSREDCLRELWIITEKLNVLYERNWTMLVHEQLRRFEGSIVAATRQGGGGAGAGGAGPGGALSGGGSASALGHFGYDSSTLDPQSWTFSEALLYSVTVITTIGHGSLTPRTAAGKLATIFYALIGVPLMLMCLSSLGSLLAEGLQCTYVKICCQLQKRRVKSATPTTAATSGGISSSEVATTAMTKRRHANCKNCKYDAAKCNEMSLNNECYEYGSMMTKRRLSLQEQNEDACQLLRKQQQHHHQQQQQQQQFYHQQQPDVMLMTTTTTGNTLLKYAPQQQQQQQQLTTATLPRQHHHQQQQQQNFVAVPTSLLRFSAAPTMPVNCYGPATATIYFPFAPSSSSALATATAAAAATHTPGGNCPQPLVKYHTIHLQPAASNKHQHRLLTSTATPTESASAAAAAMATATASTSTLEAITLPPPPAYQTSNIHTMRRAKFVTNPLPHEINALLLAGGSVSGLGLATTTMSDNSFIAAGVCGNVAPPATTTTACSTTPAAAAAATLSALLSSNSTVGNVDIMEDEDEQERERMSNCLHGTPSRVPLIAANSQQLSLTQQQQQQQQQHEFNELKSGNQSRHASSLHRHTIMQAGGLNRKTLLLTRRCQRHATAALYDATATNTETSDDEEYMQHGSSEQFVLKKLKRHRISESDDGDLDGGHANKLHDVDDDDDYSDDDDDEDANAERQQVPISLVLLILMCYICVGTVIFALWENWSLVDGAYFCFVTLSTIGYGDFVPTRSFNGPELQLYACCAYLLLGLVLVAMSFSILETQLMWKCRRIAVRLKLTKSE
ncbi:uncharacterized protein Dwil_GK15616 [Drosophila willistoni]|uniref:Potassium channel domain-containing protein n=1 Tax=Drosophila willistoni TaxID=7260 RepID=B4MS76_DROWI|nr:uncharacterized protein Dwil_GK15616 [Drosophila willistoni]